MQGVPTSATHEEKAKRGGGMRTRTVAAKEIEDADLVAGMEPSILDKLDKTDGSINYVEKIRGISRFANHQSMMLSTLHHLLQFI